MDNDVTSRHADDFPGVPSFIEESKMMFFGFAEVMLLALLGGGMNNTDLVSLIPPQHYFEARQVKVSLNSMVDIGLTEPKDGKAQIMQLTALRYLIDEADAFKKADNYANNRYAIEQIAQGKKAQDKMGFAKEYAQRLLDKLDGKKAPTVKLTPMLDDALAWFPVNVTMVGALDLRGGATANNDGIKELLKLMPEREKLQMYDAVEKMGNVRLDRIAFAFTDGNEKRNSKFYFRFSGKGSQEGLLEFFNLMNGDRGRLQAREIKDDKGMPITLLEDPNDHAPVLMLVGNTDLVMVVQERVYVKPAKGQPAPEQPKREDLVEHVLDARSKKKPNAATGQLKDSLAKVPEKAVGMFVGEIPQDLKREFGQVFDAVPPRVIAFMERTPQGLDVQVEAGLVNADDAGKAVRKIGALRKQGIDELQIAMQQPLPPGSPPIPFQGMINLMESLQVQNQSEKVQVRVVVPNGLIQQVPLLLMPRGVAIKN
jgi:hypothetical protein